MTDTHDHDDPAVPPDTGHVPVLLDEVLALLAPAPGQVLLDCTVGRGGHTAAILPRLAPGGRGVGLDVDPANLDFVRQRLSDPPVKLDLVQRNFAAARSALDELGIDRVDMLLADLGWASTQIGDPARGLSFMHEGPLDMRLDPALSTTAADLVNGLPERELADLIFRWGEERLSRRIARKIVEKRRVEPIQTTRQLAELCAHAYGPARYRQRIDPATRTFQALRIAVNDELGSLESLLSGLGDLLKPGGRAAIISFHSLEDRRVKQAFRAMAAEGRAELLARKPVVASDPEIAANPRSRSAKCRAIRWMTTSIE